MGGTAEESSKAQSSVAAVLPLMLILILTVLMIQLQSFNRLFLVLSVAPLGLIGVVAALLTIYPLLGAPTGFGATLVVTALIGWRTGPWWREPGAPLPAKSAAKSPAMAPAE